MICNKCGAQLPDGALFCGVCGQPQSVPVPEAVTAPVPEVTPAYEAPVYEAPNYGQPAQPQYDQPVQPQYDQPVQPQYDQPVQPQYDQPVQPQYDQPVQAQYGQPAQPQYSQPAQPQYSQPVQPQYDQPAQQWQQHEQPQYGQYGQPAQPPYGQPVYNQANYYQQQETPKKKKFTIGNILGILGIIACIVSAFLPLMSAAETDISLLEYFKYGSYLAIGLLIAVAVFGLLGLVFFAIKLNGGALICSLGLVAYATVLVIGVLDAVSEASYAPGISIGVYIAVAGAAFSLIGAIVALAFAKK